MDFLRCNFLAVGNDAQTTAQYGGTGLAGDVGQMYKDSYGLDTSMGVGRRIASVIGKLGLDRDLKGKLKVLFPILQDKNGEALEVSSAIN